jgi:1-acyl-sn-glycerol-3-phosphate acyltransferase
MNLLRRIHTAYGFGIFAILFMVFLPLFFIPIFFPRQFRITGILNRWWAKLLFLFVFLPYRVQLRAPLNKGPYIFCPNHFSFIDIPTMGLCPVNTIFVGKSEMSDIPLFGFMYRRLHITVNRSSLKSRANTLRASAEAIDQGKSLVIFPEGGMTSAVPPNLGRFKDGAFRTAIEKQIPVVPVTIPFNWLILPDASPIVLHRGTIEIIFHEPIETTGMTLDDVDALKERVFTTLDTELKKHDHRS